MSDTVVKFLEWLEQMVSDGSDAEMQAAVKNIKKSMPIIIDRCQALENEESP